MSLTFRPLRTTVSLCSWRCSQKHHRLSTSQEFYKLPSPVHCQHCSYWVTVRSFHYEIIRKCQPVCCKVKIRNVWYTPAGAIPVWRCRRITRAHQPPYCFIHFQPCGPRVCTCQVRDCLKPAHTAPLSACRGSQLLQLTACCAGKHLF